MVDPLKELANRFGDVDGASKIKSAISKARSALKSRSPDKEKALASFDKAVEEYDEAIAWRTAAAESLNEPLANYQNSLKPTLGIRQQQRLTREQALYVARCNAEHRDISLSF